MIDMSAATERRHLKNMGNNVDGFKATALRLRSSSLTPYLKHVADNFIIHMDAKQVLDVHKHDSDKKMDVGDTSNPYSLISSQLLFSASNDCYLTIIKIKDTQKSAPVKRSGLLIPQLKIL